MSVIVWPKKSALEKNPEQVISQVCHALAGRVEAAYIFGSLARGEIHPGSDLDLIVIKETKRPFLERAREFDDLWEIFPRLDLLVYTPAEFAALSAETAPGFWKSVTGEMKKIL